MTTKTAPKPHASERAHQLSGAVIEMALRFGMSNFHEGMAASGDDGLCKGKPTAYWSRAERRQYQALQRLTRALRDLDA